MEEEIDDLPVNLARFSCLVSRLYSLCKYLLAVSIGITLKTVYDSPVKCSCPLVCAEQRTRTFEQEIFELNLQTQLREPFRPSDATEVIEYDFFNASAVVDYRRDDRLGSLQRIDKLDIADIVSQVTALLGSSSRGGQWRITSLENGYRRLDLVRGIEYVIHAAVLSTENRTAEFRKLCLVRPFAVMHLLSNVIVDDSKLVHFVVAIRRYTPQLQRFLLNFEAVCAGGNERGYLLIVICSDNLKEVEAVRTAANVMQRQHHETVHVRVVHTRRQFDVALALDLGSRQLPGSALIAFSDVEMQFSRGALRRCRLHAVENRQVYYPVIFAQYSPDIVHQFSSYSVKDSELISQHTGEWADYDYSVACMYAADYRAIGGFSLSAADFHKDLYQRHIAAGFQCFVSFTLRLLNEVLLRFSTPYFSPQEAIFRAVDLGLVRLYNERCNKLEYTTDNYQSEICRTKHIGSQDQLRRMLAGIT